MAAVPHGIAEQLPLTRRQVLAGAALLAGATAWPGIGQAQDAWPSRPIRVVVPYPAGGNTDLTAREIMGEVGRILNQSIIVDNKAGANGIIGTEAVAKSPADGYTVLVAIGAFTINPVLQKSLPYKVDDFEPVGLTGRVNLVLAASPVLPARSFAELVALGRSGMKLSYDSSGIGSALHLVGERISLATGIGALHVPYKGIAQSLPDIISGRVSFTINTVAALGPYIREGRLRPLAVLSKNRSAELPGVATIAEAGYPTLESYAWQGLLVPADTPQAVVTRLASAVATALSRQALRDKLVRMGTDPVSSSPAEFAAFLRDDQAKVREVVRATNLKAD
ncbi:tripartite tricarboxylate transporter substrate binding protein [Ramlibacter sp.]|jgi:tripartite-type tricarboxylate transporter receptor subunit TctC|uniref:Bug family tripartite tricarboxylate transporter substrate binding protein n=1 Tax=Ramlibacter sp. TaxID=1917967 RepID=UPI002605EF55|nr:tripartite tricarboxylate transporter substrate binding protein [Ramlibacter sp.]